MQNLDDRVREIVADILDEDPDSIDESTAMDNTANWDSLNHVNICLALEEEFGISLEVHEMESMLSVYDILDVVQQKL